jgi:undecaprenyl diphosphate synthase
MDQPERHITQDKTSEPKMVKHLACIMDGNRRWAMRQSLTTLFGHKKGLEAINRVADFCLTKKIPHLSLYTFSTENLQNRSQEEQNYLFEVLAQEALSDLEVFKRKNIAMRFIGDRALFPKSVQPVCETIEKETAHCTALQVNFLLCYGGRQEIADATRRIASQVAQGDLQLSDITPDLFEQFLWTAGTPSPDLIIRTGEQHRLSNFLLFQCAYSELYFLDCMWPDISVTELEAALNYYTECRKMFGK